MTMNGRASAQQMVQPSDGTAWQRIMFPSLLGFTPRSESRSVFSISCIDDLSNGLMMMVRASGVWNDASCCSGVGAP